MKEFWWYPSDYSPHYFVRVDGEKVELIKIHNIAHEYPGSYELPKEQYYVDYIAKKSDEIRKFGGFL